MGKNYAVLVTKNFLWAIQEEFRGAPYEAFRFASQPTLADRRRAYEKVFGIPSHPGERAVDETVVKYTMVVELREVVDAAVSV